MDKLAEYFIPDELARRGGIDRRRAALAVKTVFVLLVWGPTLALLYWFMVGSNELAWVLAVATATTVLSPFLLKWTGKPAVAGNFMCVPLYGLIVWLAWFNGGLVGPSMSWLGILPIFALLFAGKRSAIFWMVAALVAVGVFFGLHVGGYEFIQQLSEWDKKVIRLVEVSGLAVIIFGVVYFKDSLQQWLVDSLRAREEETRTILETAPDGIITVDKHGQVRSANEAAAQTFRRTRQALEGRRLVELVPTWDGLLDGQTGATAPASSQEHLGRKPDGGQFPIEIAAGKVGRGAAADLVMVMRDITDRKAAERAIRQARDDALAASRAKSTFLANMSHELRTPLNAVIGYSEMIAEEIHFARQSDEPGSEYTEKFLPDLERIQVAGKHLVELVNDILDLSKIEAGQMQVHLEEFAVDELIDDVAATVGQLAVQNDNELVVDVGDDIDRMYSDVTKVRQILFNLASNACKFTDHGQISLTATAKTDADSDVIVFQVADTGIGLSDEQLDEIFEAFTQADSSTTRQFGGTGLGLTITDHFCEMLGGDMTAESSLGQGSAFTVELPVRGPDAGARDAAEDENEPDDGSMNAAATAGGPAVDAPAATVLVVDDDPTMRDLFTRILSKAGYHVVTAANGSEGLLLAEQLEPVAITLDVMMPAMDGWAMLTQLQDEPALADIPVIMVTIVSERSRGLALGADHYLVKPVDRAALVDLVDSYRGTPKSGPILVVDDDESTRGLLRRTLRSDGWEVVEAENGSQAFDQLEGVAPQLVVLDLMMPQMDGFEFLARFRRQDRWSNVPVVVVTAKELSDREYAELRGGVTEIVDKGGRRREELLADVCELVGDAAESAADNLQSTSVADISPPD